MIQIAGSAGESLGLLAASAFPREDGSRRIGLLGQPAGPGEKRRQPLSPNDFETPGPLTSP